MQFLGPGLTASRSEGQGPERVMAIWSPTIEVLMIMAFVNISPRPADLPAASDKQGVRLMMIRPTGQRSETESE